MIVLFIVIVVMLIKASKEASEREPKAGTIIRTVEIHNGKKVKTVKKGIPELDEIYPDEHSPELLNVDEIHKRLEARRKAMLSIILLCFTLFCKAPDLNLTYIVTEAPIQPYEALISAVTWVESQDGLYVYNPLERAVGQFQIRQIRVDHYNQLTGSHYKLEDFYDYNLSKQMFLFFADRIGPYDIKKIACRWNGSGPKTEDYWASVNSYLTTASP
jgi:hypothetical protein